MRQFQESSKVLTKNREFDGLLEGQQQSISCSKYGNTAIFVLRYITTTPRNTGPKFI